LNYYKRYIGDYQSDTAHLSMTEHGAYNLLLDYVYGTEKPLPKQKAAIYRICRAFEDHEREAIDSVLTQYFTEREDGWVNDKALRVMETDLPRIEAARANGLKGGRPKGKTQRDTQRDTHWDNSQNPDLNPDGTQVESSPQPQPQPYPKPQPQPKPQPRRKNTLAVRPDNVSTSVWEDFKTLRAAKRAPLTVTAFKGLTRQSEKAGISVEDALVICCDRGWQTFKADWHAKSAPKLSPAQQAIKNRQERMNATI